MPSLASRIQSELIYQSLLAMGRTAPNPPVGCVLLLSQNTGQRPILIGGATESVGKRHAEVVCLDLYQQYIKDEKESKHTYRLYVTLEPCSHSGRTPPCTRRILEEPKIQRVLAWERDPYLKTSGIAVLQKEGCAANFLTNKTTQLGQAFLGGFLNRIRNGTPRLHLKVACSQDGYIGMRSHPNTYNKIDKKKKYHNLEELHNFQLHISEPLGISFGHMLRAKCDAVVVGMGTLMADKPQLSLRSTALHNNYTKQFFSKYISGIKPSNREKKTANEFIQGKHQYDNIAPLIYCNNLFRFYTQLTQAIHQNENIWQPERVFILDRCESKQFEYYKNFFALQENINQSTKKKARYFVIETHQESWRKAFPELPISTSLPEFKKITFAKSLREALSKMEYNEVLVEGGAGMLANLYAELTPEDIIYILRSKKNLEQLLRDAKEKIATKKYIPISIPEFLEMEQKTKLLATYNLSSDTLELRNAC